VNDRPSEALIELLARFAELATEGQVQKPGPPGTPSWPATCLAPTRFGSIPWSRRGCSPRFKPPKSMPVAAINSPSALCPRQALGALALPNVSKAGTFSRKRTARVYLLGRAHREANVLLAELEQLTARSARAAIAGLLPLETSGHDQGRLWAASPDEPDPGRRPSASRGPIRSAAE